MADWPNIAPPTFGTEWEIYKPQIVTKYDGAYFQSRAAVTRATYFMRQHWDAMTHTDLLLLQAHFDANVGSAFNRTNPLTGAVESCCYMTDSIPARVWEKSEGEFVYSVDCPIRKM